MITTKYNSVNYLSDNNTNLYQEYNHITNTASKSVSITPIYDEDVNNENTQIINNTTNTNELGENKEISMAEILTNYNYDKSSSDKNENINIDTYASNENNNKYRAKSPEFTRKNRFLNNYESNSASTLYTRSPAPTISRQRNTSYDYSQVNNIYSQNQNQNLNTIKDDNYILYASSNQDKNISPYTYTGNVSNFNDSSNVENPYNVDTTLIYPSTSTHINYTNSNTITSDIQLNQDINQLYTDSNNTILSSNNNNNVTTTYYTSIPITPISTTNENLLNNIDSTTLQTINNIPLNETVYNPTQYIYQINSDGSITYIPTTSIAQDTSNQLNNTNYIISPSTNNQIQYPVSEYTNLNTTLTPSTANVIPALTYQTKYYTGNGANYTNYTGQNNQLLSLSPYYYTSLNKNPYSTRYISSPIISNFNANNNINNTKSNLKKKNHKKSSPSFSSFSEEQSENSSITHTDNFKKIQKKSPNNKNYRKSPRGRYTGSRAKNNNQMKPYKNIPLKIKPDSYFTQYMFEHINLIRTKPQSFIPTIRNGIENITYDKRGNLIYKGNLKVALYKGKKAFEEAIIDLNETQIMEPLIFKKELCVEISDVEKEFKSGDYLRKKIGEKIDDGIPIRAFWRDIIRDPRINFLLMIVDDNPIKRGDKRKDILDPNMKYIGISSGYLGNNFVCYTVLSNE